MVIRPARADDADILSELAMRSKAHWGYDQRFLEACRHELAIHPSTIENHRVMVAVRRDAVVGFSALAARTQTAELVDLFVEPREIGSGVGRALFRDALDAARKQGCQRLRVEADPHALSFYERLGARKIGEVPSGSIENRMLPLMEVDLTDPGQIS